MTLTNDENATLLYSARFGKPPSSLEGYLQRAASTATSIGDKQQIMVKLHSAMKGTLSRYEAI